MSSGCRMELRMDSNWENAGYVHDAVWSAVMASYADEDLSDAVSMTCTELVGNAIKFGVRRYRGEEAVVLRIEGGEEEVQIEIVNEIDPEDHRDLATLEETIQWVRGFQTPFETYLERLKALTSAPPGESRMGLTRIAYEGGGLLDFFVNDNDRLSVSAIIPVE